MAHLNVLIIVHEKDFFAAADSHRAKNADAIMTVTLIRCCFNAYALSPAQLAASCDCLCARFGMCVKVKH